MSSLNSCSDLHSTINEQSLHDQSSSNMNIDHSNSIHDQSSSSMNIDHSNSSNSRYSFDFELYNPVEIPIDHPHSTDALYCST
ncbi:unnamed protein product [Lactuca virosa]|uniref:Uncharacterized protein n=1 Tax=Lactuca virosa TaxID=75947 RepID=A0AAU9MAD1_9ASTR|nr:unnamed protein product [Lactuca virosa]